MKKFFLLLNLLSFSAFASYTGSNPLITQKQLLADPEKYVVVDVRSPREFAAGHIKGAINIPHYLVADNLDKLTSEKPLVVHCKSGYRAWKAEQAMMKNGISNILHLHGDMDGWQAKKLPTEK